MHTNSFKSMYTIIKSKINTFLSCIIQEEIIQNYLINRKQYVKYKTYESNFK